MSLMRLLSVSRSFCAHIPEMGRYKMARRGELPNFGASRRPAPARATPAQVELPMPATAPGARLPPSKPFGRGTELAEAGQFRLAGGGGAPPSRSVPAPAAKQVGSTPGWWVGVGHWLRRWAQAWVVPSRARRLSRREPVQTAFPLESVRVVRNDLSEGDFELVTPRKTPARAPELVRASDGADRSEVAEPTWGRAAMRWLAGARNGP